MISSHVVTLRCVKTTDLTFLRYLGVPVHREQSRFVGRSALQPEIDLNEFTCSAIIDWLDVVVLLLRPTQFRFVQKEIEGATGKR